MNIFQLRVAQIDATRISDGLQVYIKRVKSDSEELRIARFLSDPSRVKDPDNHTVPVLDVFTDNLDLTLSCIVMPLLQYFDEPPFEYVAEVVDFVDQLLEVRSTRFPEALSYLY